MRKSILMKKNVPSLMSGLSACFIIATALVSSHAYAATSSIESGYLFNVNSSFITDNMTGALRQFFQDLNFNIPQYTLGTNPTVQIQNIKVKVISKDYKITPNGSLVEFNSSNNAVVAEIGAITVDEVIHKEIGGIIADIRIYASCEGVKMSLSDAKSQIGGSLEPLIENGLIKVQIKNPVITLGSPQFDLSSTKCTGAQGFENEIKATLEHTLQDQKLTQEIIQSQIIANLSVLTNNLSYRWDNEQKILEIPIQSAEGTIQKIEIWITPKDLTPTASGWQNKGILRVRFPYSLSSSSNHVHPIQNFDFNSTQQLENFIVIPEATITDLVQSYFSPQSWVFREDATHMQGFANLLKSRFTQMFVWNDLVRWPMSSKFPIVATTGNTPKIALISKRSFSFESNVLLDMYGNNGSSGNEPYVHFKIPISSQMNFSLTNDKIDFKLSNANFNISYAFDFNYCFAHYNQGGIAEKYFKTIYNLRLQDDKGGCSNISIGLVSSTMKSYLASQNFSFPVPSIKTLGGVEIKAKDLEYLPSQKVMMLKFGN